VRRLLERLCPFGMLLPIALMFGSYVPAGFFLWALAHAMGIPFDAPMPDNPYGIKWFIAAIVLACPYIGFWLGFLLDIAIMRFGLGWSWEDIFDIYSDPRCLRCLIPRSWRVMEVRSDSEGLDPEDSPMYDAQLDNPGWS
jgi:hypothetical protein